MRIHIKNLKLNFLITIIPNPEFIQSWLGFWGFGEIGRAHV